MNQITDRQREGTQKPHGQKIGHSIRSSDSPLSGLKVDARNAITNSVLSEDRSANRYAIRHAIARHHAKPRIKVAARKRRGRPT